MSGIFNYKFFNEILQPAVKLSQKKRKQKCKKFPHSFESEIKIFSLPFTSKLFLHSSVSQHCLKAFFMLNSLFSIKSETQRSSVWKRRKSFGWKTEHVSKENNIRFKHFAKLFKPSSVCVISFFLFLLFPRRHKHVSRNKAMKRRPRPGLFTV